MIISITPTKIIADTINKINHILESSFSKGGGGESMDCVFWNLREIVWLTLLYMGSIGGVGATGIICSASSLV